MRELHATLRGFNRGAQPKHLTEDQIQQAEAVVGARLPEDYREFIKDFGDFCLFALFPVRGGRLSEVSIDEFHSVAAFLSYYNGDPQWFPDGAICIGMSGNLHIFLFFKGKDKGKVRIRHEIEFYLVADSFTEFMDLLKFEFEDDEHEKPYVIEDAAPFWETFSTK